MPEYQEKNGTSRTSPLDEGSVFPDSGVHSERGRKVGRKLLLWRLGVITGEAIKCVIYQDSEVVSRNT